MVRGGLIATNLSVWEASCLSDCLVSASRDLAAGLRLEYLDRGPGSTGGGAAAGPPVLTFFPSF
jgi:hypothetical protein